MNAVGTNTAHSTSAIAMIGPDTSSIALRVASIGVSPMLDVALHVLHHHDRIVDDDADGEHQAEQRQRVQREAEREHHGERADQRHRHRDQRNDRRAPGLQEHDHDEHDQQDRLRTASRPRLGSTRGRRSSGRRRCGSPRPPGTTASASPSCARTCGRGLDARSSRGAGRCRWRPPACCRAGCAARTGWSRARCGRRRERG